MAKGNRAAAQSNLESAKEAYRIAFAPLREMPTIDELKELYDKCHSNSHFSKADLFICSGLLLYNPEGLCGGSIKLQLAQMMGEVLGRAHNNIYMAKHKLVLWLNLYPQFFQAVEQIYNDYTKA